MKHKGFTIMMVITWLPAGSARDIGAVEFTADRQE